MTQHVLGAQLYTVRAFTKTEADVAETLRSGEQGQLLVVPPLVQDGQCATGRRNEPKWHE